MTNKKMKNSAQLLIPFSSRFIPVLSDIPRLSAFRDLTRFPEKVVYDYHKAKHGFFSFSKHCRDGRLHSWRVKK